MPINKIKAKLLNILIIVWITCLTINLYWSSYGVTEKTLISKIIIIKEIIIG